MTPNSAPALPKEDGGAAVCMLGQAIVSAMARPHMAYTVGR